MTFERKAILRCNQNVLESTHMEHEFEHKFFILSMEIERVIVVSIWPSELFEIRIPIMS